MASVICETEDDFCKFYFPLLDPRIPPESAESLTQAGVRWYNVDIVRERGIPELERIAVVPGISALILLNLNEKLRREENLQSEFILKMLTKEWRSPSQTNSLILAGDWNLALDEVLSPQSSAAGRKDAQTLLDLATELELADPFRLLSPEDPGYTWTSHMHRDRRQVTRRRLDYFLVSSQALEGVTAVQHIAHPLSDHKPVVAEVKLHNTTERGRGFFRLNSQNLEDPSIGSWLEKHMKAWESVKQYFDSTVEWLDSGIAIASGVMNVCSKILARNRNQRDAECRRRVEEAEEQMEGHPISTMVWAAEREKRMAEWESIQANKERRWAEVLKEKGIEVHDKMTKETFQRLQPRLLQQQMVELSHPFDEREPRASSASGLLEYAKLYYEDILTTRRPQDDFLTDLSENSDMWEDTTVSLLIAARLDLGRPVTVEETAQTLKSKATGKSPGVDGLTVEFFRKNWTIFGPALIELYNKVLSDGKLGKGMTHGVIAVLFKKGDKADVKNWRPISLLNVSYKILAKTLARQLGRYLPDLVGGDQGAFVQGRSIFNNIITAIEVLEVVQSENLDMVVLLINLEKAYDKRLQLCFAIGCGVLPRSTLRWWMRRRTGGTWEDLRLRDDATNNYFREKLRMSRRVFMEIGEACAPLLQRQVMFYKEPLPPEQIVAYALYRWASGESYDNNTSSFSIGRASRIMAVRDVTNALLRVYGDRISWPTGVRKHVVLRAFLDKGFPNCHGAVDCTHIYVDKPTNAPGENYFDRKHRFSVIAQVVVDLDLRVLDVFVGYPGSCHDIRVIQLSSLSRRAEEGVLFRGPPVTLLGGGRTNGYILGDNRYPPSEWVVVPYGVINQHPDEERFDTKQKVARGVVERAFGRLKGMWRFFLRTHKTNLETLPRQFTAVCILHNILLDAGVEFNENLLWEVDENGVPAMITTHRFRTSNEGPLTKAKDVKDTTIAINPFHT
ncbi:hypothetical protein CBR_g8954 [Chara braunii]|uniref:DDE Tnp4 domain-containing protein n=1 Tax=Chara braunii TaxID=69332 RepID=A0A388KNA1_CHABU|nr:hypothetical protein CBR_g8954 [Chara braunii]|eukprot:GBG71536.1 hypothetical protein CBR_g8954 [Chara braunii]